jgi:histidinol-phosphatase (PHP family)
MGDRKPQLPPDYHTHTELCRHATGRPVDYARAAKTRGVPELAITDHAPTEDGYDIEHRMELDEFPTYRQWVAEAVRTGGPPVLFGVEADYYEGCTAFLGNWLASHAFDIVLGSVHYLDYWAFDDPAQRNLWEHVDIPGVWRKYFALIAAMADSGLYDVAAHLDLPKKFGYRPPDSDLSEMVRPVLDRIAAAGMAIEINTSGLLRPAAEVFPSPQILAWARERDIPVTFGSDAHSPERIGADFEHAVQLAREAGYAFSTRYRRRRPEPIPLP